MKLILLCIGITCAQNFGEFSLRSQLTTYQNTLESQTEYIIAPDTTTSTGIASIESSSEKSILPQSTTNAPTSTTNAPTSTTNAPTSTYFTVLTSTSVPVTTPVVVSASSSLLKSTSTPPVSSTSVFPSKVFTTTTYSCNIETQWSTSTLYEPPKTLTNTHLSTVVVYKYANSSVSKSLSDSEFTGIKASSTSNPVAEPAIDSSMTPKLSESSVNPTKGNCFEATPVATKTTTKTQIKVSTSVTTVTEPVPVWYVIPATDNEYTIPKNRNDTASSEGDIPNQPPVWPYYHDGFPNTTGRYLSHTAQIVPSQSHLSKRGVDISYSTTILTATNILNTGTSAYTTHITIEVPLPVTSSTTTTTSLASNYGSKSVSTAISPQSSPSSETVEEEEEGIPFIVLPSLSIPFTASFLSIPSMNIPSFSLPAVNSLPTTLPNLILPTVTTPPITLPTITVPTSISSGVAPTVSFPLIALPSISLPPISLPTLTLSPLAIPTGVPPSISLPVSLPTVSLPSITLPSVSLPSFSIQPISIPTEYPSTISLPLISIPPITLPSLSIPSVGLPSITFSSINVPSISWPSLSPPSVSLPTHGIIPFSSGNYSCEPLGLNDKVMICSKNSQPKIAPLCLVMQLFVFVAVMILFL